MTLVPLMGDGQVRSTGGASRSPRTNQALIAEVAEAAAQSFVLSIANSQHFAGLNNRQLLIADLTS
jgi:hypothetical protein